MSDGIRISSPGKAGMGASATVGSCCFTTFFVTGACATITAFGGTQDTSAIAVPSRRPVVNMSLSIWELSSVNAVPPNRKRLVCGLPCKAEPQRQTLATISRNSRNPCLAGSGVAY